MIGPENFIDFEIPGDPIHPAYFLLTSIQKSDYVRAYMINFYGGGYSDVKHIHHDVQSFYDKLKNDDNLMALGWA
jgi:hypothetical protein